MKEQKERGPGSWTRQDFFHPESGILTPLGSQVQNLALRQAELNRQKQGRGFCEMSLLALEEEKAAVWELARKLGYCQDGQVDCGVLWCDWEVILARGNGG